MIAKKRIGRILEETLCYIVGLSMFVGMLWMLALPMLSAENDVKRINKKFGTTYEGSDLLVPTDEIRNLHRELK